MMMDFIVSKGHRYLLASPLVLRSLGRCERWRPPVLAFPWRLICIGKVLTFLRLFFLFRFEDNREKNGRLYSENTKLWVMCMGSLSRQVGELQGVVEELKSEACAKEVDLNLIAQVAVVEEEQR